VAVRVRGEGHARKTAAAVPIVGTECPRKSECGRHHHGRCGLAAEPGPREVRGIFRENDIDEAVLPSLTHENLKRAWGRVVWASREAAGCHPALGGDASGKAASVDAATESSTSSVPRRAPASHREVLGLGRLNGPLGSYGPEDLREVILAYQKGCLRSTGAAPQT
jgi:hypothetical protein